MGKISREDILREILFRGLRTDGKGWVEGDLLHFYPHHHKNGNVTIVEGGCVYHEVIPETVGQYTGLKDKDAVKIFEGDILSGVNGSINLEDWEWESEVNYDENGLHNVPTTWGGENNWDSTHWFKVIGNVHDNPELEVK